MKSPEHGVLGNSVDYEFEYNPSLLFPISRKPGREFLGINNILPFTGVDRWTAYELSWLNAVGLPQVAIAELDFPCESPCIIESKSLKLYLNTLNQTLFANMEKVRLTMTDDLSKACGMPVYVRLFSLSEYVVASASRYTCIDPLPVSCMHYDVPDPYLLKTGTEIMSQQLYSQLFRSLCPVTGQPDWASVFIDYTGRELMAESLLQYLVSYRNHQGFHEQCVEQIFKDISVQCQPERLTVYARFMRRGGLDINPLRSSHAIPIPDFHDVRQ